MSHTESVATHKHVVLLSGGLDSAFCAVRAKQQHQNVVALFVDYGQPYIEPERVASQRIADALGLPYIRHAIPHIDHVGNTFPNRNSRLIEIAVTHARDVYVGTRCPLPWFDVHGDSNWLFMRRLQKKMRLRLHMPAMMKTKRYLWRAIAKHDASLPSMVYSTENINL